MPCYTISTVSVDLGNRNVGLMEKSLGAMGFTVYRSGDTLTFSGTHNETGIYHSGSYINGQLQYSGNLEVNAVKRAYSAQVIKKQAAKFGWKLTKTAQGQYSVQKR